MPLNKVYIGIAATDTLNSITKDIGESHPDVQMFLNHCREFLIECVHQIQYRFHDLDKFEFVECLSPSTAYSMKVPSLVHCLKHMPYLKDIVDVHALDSEWRQHAMCPNVTGDMNIQNYWSFIFIGKKML